MKMIGLGPGVRRAIAGKGLHSNRAMRTQRMYASRCRSVKPQVLRKSLALRIALPGHSPALIGLWHQLGLESYDRFSPTRTRCRREVLATSSLCLCKRSLRQRKQCFCRFGIPSVPMISGHLWQASKGCRLTLSRQSCGKCRPRTGMSVGTVSASVPDQTSL